ncbi:MAG: hypothetical protein HOD58_09245 [Gammaproteobacteria bacterium]|jgi:hypothetical protein|nr:hypothetical protein [Gammaproteobacteria bacterium]
MNYWLTATLIMALFLVPSPLRGKARMGGGYITKRLPLLLMTPLLSGCGSTPELKPTTLATAAVLPQYRAGDTFLFSDGSVEKVTAVRGDKVDWESRGGAFRYTTYRNFILPKQQWETDKKRVTVQYSGDRNLFWPLRKGQSEYLSTVVSVNEKPGLSSKSYIQSWRCQVGGSYRVEVAAGSFDTQRIECDRSTLMGRWMQTRIWYYAPEVGHYVLQEDEYAPTSIRRHTERRKELVALMPSDLHLSAGGIDSPEHHFQQALETLRSGEQSEWRDSEDRYARTVLLKRSFRTQQGQYCREYVMKRRDDGRIQHYQGSACRGEAGVWRIAVARPGQQRGAL